MKKIKADHKLLIQRKLPRKINIYKDIRPLLYTFVSFYPMYRIIETGLHQYGSSLVFILFYVYAICCSSVEDILTMRIPDIFSLTVFLSGFFFHLTETHIKLLLTHIIAAIIIFIILTVVSVLSKGGIGGGDIKIISASSVLIGFSQTLSAFCIASILSAIMCIALVLVQKFCLKRKKTLRSLPFGPFYAIGLLIQIFSNTY